MIIERKQDGGWGEYYALKNIRQMFNRFRKDIENHNIALVARFWKVKGISRWYYYNIIEDPEAFKEYELRSRRKSFRN